MMKKLEEEIQEVIKLNKQRNAILDAAYNPISGKGSPLKRVKLHRDHLSYILIPLEMAEDPAVKLVLAAGSVKAVCARYKDTIPMMTPNLLWDELLEKRLDYDFEYWAVTAIKIQDKESKQLIPFKLRPAQRKLLLELETMRLAGVPIRAILLKARQWGGSTLVQLYMLWIQARRRKNWHSVIVTDVEDQARTVRSHTSRAIKNYPKFLGELDLSPFEGSSKNKIIPSRGCIISIGSMQEPDSLRSNDFAMMHLCISGETLIPTKDGFLKKAENISVGDNVYTHTGAISTVKNITRSVPTGINGNGDSVIIKLWGGSNIEMTPNHPVYTNRGFINAENVLKTDLLMIPIRPITHNTKSIILKTFYHRNHGGGSIPVGSGKHLCFNLETGFAVGYYLAEGSVHVKGTFLKEISFTRHDSEAAYADRAIAALDGLFKSTSRKKRAYTKTTQDLIYDRALADFFYNNFRIKEQKRIPDWVFDCGPEFLQGLLIGYLSGDGSKSNAHQGKHILVDARATTISSSIAMQIRDIAASLGLGWGAIDVKEAGNYYNRNCKKSYTVRWAGSSARNIRKLLGWEVPDNGRAFTEKSFLKDGFVFVKIREIKRSKIAVVYDIEVDHNDHSFRTISFSVKNSEVGLWKVTEGKKPEDLVQALRGALAAVPDSLAVLESTAKGVGNFFHREWEAAERKESTYKPIFIPWFDIEMYRKPLTGSVEEFMASMNEYDKFLWKIGATLEGINWYNWFKAAERYDDWRMKSEFPSTAQEAFQSTGSRVFRIEDVLKARANTIAPKLIGDLFASQQKGAGALDRINFGGSPEGCLYVWELPDKTIKVDNRYCVFMDIGGTTPKADWTVIKVVDRYWMIDGGRPETVAVWRGHLDTDLAAWKAAQIASWYDDALLAIEVNSIKKRKGDDPDKSLTVLDEIMEYYPNLYMRTKIDSLTREESRVPGFHTNVSTKGMIIDCLIAATRDEEYIERDVRACDEMDYYEKKSDGSMGAVDGKNDDHVIVSAGCAWLALKYMERPTLIANTQQTTRTQAQGMASF